MPDDDLDPIALNTCSYLCDGDEFILTGGTAPPGYYCVPVLGPCFADEAGETTTAPPTPEPIPDPTPSPPSEEPPAGEAMYRYEPKTDSLYFANANKAPDKKSYLGKVSLTELKNLFPDVATTAEAKKAANPGKSFNQAIPAISKDQRP